MPTCDLAPGQPLTITGPPRQRAAYQGVGCLRRRSVGTGLQRRTAHQVPRQATFAAFAPGQSGRWLRLPHQAFADRDRARDVCSYFAE